MTHLTNNPQTNTGMKSKKEILNSISFRLYNCDFELAKHRRLGYEIEQMYEMAIDEAMASTSASQSSPPEGALNGDELGELIDRHIGPMHGGLEMSSIDYFKQTGTINGSFRLRLISLLKFHQYKLQDKAALSTPPVSAMEDGWVKVERVVERLKKYRDTEMEKHIRTSGLNFAINELTELLVNKK